MRRNIFALVVAAVVGTAAPLNAESPTMRVGTFDSRIVALAYYNSSEYARDSREITEPQKREAMQVLKHLQTFSHASIPNVLEKLQPVIPRVAADNGVSLIVSEWEIAYRAPNVEYIDVTSQLVAHFKPSEKVNQWIDGLKKQRPLPLVEIATMDHRH